jgi:hypothetical protein
MVAAVARACALGDDLGVPIGIPEGWEKKLVKEMSPDVALDAEEVATLTEAALRRGDQPLAYQASGVGLVRAGPGQEARFLFLRALSLPSWEAQRRGDCLAAVVHLARRQRQMDLVARAVEMSVSAGERAMSPAEAEGVLQRERSDRSFPDFRPDPPYPVCSHCGKRHPADPLAMADDDEEDDPLFDLPPELDVMPAELVSMLLEIAEKYGRAGGEIPPLESLREMDPELFQRLGRKRKKRR